MERSLYFKPNELELDQVGIDIGVISEWNERISIHEQYGLEKMGATVTKHFGYTEITHTNDSSFLNRITEVSMEEEDFGLLLDNLPKNYSVILNPLSRPRNAMDILVSKGLENTLSSTVTGGLVPNKFEVKAKVFDVLNIGDAASQDFIEFYSLFSSFFLKPGESIEEGRVRVAGNLKNGTHLLLRKDHVPAGIVGTIDIKDTSSIYCGIVSPEYRASSIYQEMASALCNEVNKKGIKYYYGKSRNRGYLFGLRIMFGFNHLYNEKVFTYKDF